MFSFHEPFLFFKDQKTHKDWKVTQDFQAQLQTKMLPKRTPTRKSHQSGYLRRTHLQFGRRNLFISKLHEGQGLKVFR